jgi:hypothetical protein
MSRLVLVATYSAVGGPEKSGMGSDGFGGVKVVVHSYSDHLIKYPSGHGSAPFELHFFPGLSKLVVVGKARSA